MLVLPQEVDVVWTANTKEHYESKGYTFTKYYKKFSINVLDLPLNSGTKVKVKCDHCDVECIRVYQSHTSYKLDLCNDCKKKHRKLPFSEVKSIFEENDCTLISTAYKSTHDKLKFICSCGNECEKSLVAFKKAPHCKKCTAEIRRKLYKIPYVEMNNITNENGWKVLSTEEEYYKKRKIKFMCDKGHIGEGTTRSIRNKCCIECGYEKSRKRFQHDFEYVEKIFSDRDCILLTKEYKNANEKLDYICSCGNETSSTLNNFIRAKGCSECYFPSRGEQIINELLDENDSYYIKQYMMEDCINIKPLRFDYAILDDNEKLICLIEYDGHQHFRAVNWFGGEESFINQKKKDEIKNNYCKENNLMLYRIPYWEEKSLPTIIENILYNPKESSLDSFLIC